MEKEDRQKMADAVSSMIDKWVSDLVVLLKSGEGSLPKRGLWDRFKGGISNVFYGRDNEDNPYYWMNRFGDDLGSKGSWRGAVKSENFNPGIFTLSEYGFLRSSLERLEDEAESLMVLDESGSFEDLRIFQMIKGSAEKLKGQLRSFIMGDSPASSVSDTVPDTVPGEVPEPPRKINEPRGSRSSPPPNRSAGDGSTGTKPAGKDSSNPPSVSSSAPTPATKDSSTGGNSTGTKPTSKDSSNPPSTKPASSEDSSNPTGDGSSSGKFAESLREAIRAVKERDHSFLKPNNYWLTPSGKLSSLAIPKAMAWLAMKSHIDMSDDEQVENALGQEIGEKFKGLLAKSHDGNSLLKNFSQKVPKSLVSKALSDLGVDESLLKKEKPAQNDKEDEGSDSAEEIDSNSDESNEITKTLVGIQRMDDIEQAVQAVAEKIVKPVLRSAAADNKQGIKDWWINLKQQNREIDSLRVYLMDGGESQFLKDLMRISELSEDEILSSIS